MSEYTDREIETLFRGIDDKLDSIKEQTEKTNGRVSKLESWQWMMVGGLAVVTIIVVPLLLDVIRR